MRMNRHRRRPNSSNKGSSSSKGKWSSHLRRPPPLVVGVCWVFGFAKVVAVVDANTVRPRHPTRAYNNNNNNNNNNNKLLLLLRRRRLMLPRTRVMGRAIAMRAGVHEAVAVVVAAVEARAVVVLGEAVEIPNASHPPPTSRCQHPGNNHHQNHNPFSRLPALRQDHSTNPQATTTATTGLYPITTSLG